VFIALICVQNSGTNKRGSANWKWIGGGDYDYGSKQQTNDALPWASGEPSGEVGCNFFQKCQEDYVVLWKDGKWNDVPNAGPYRSIIEKRPDPQPRRVSKGKWIAVAAGTSHSLAIKEDGTLWAWGDNSKWQLGNLSNIDAYEPINIGIDDEWATVAAGSTFSLAQKKDGSLWAWGSGLGLGHGQGVYSPSPSQIMIGSPWISFAAGKNHTVAVRADGTLWAWGKNANGQLGIGNTGDKDTPTQVPTKLDNTSILHELENNN